jgi:RNA polymerase sigma-70 factor, ECF subfamily
MAETEEPELTLSLVVPLVYEELRRLARLYLAREQRGQSLQPTALVGEAYLKLAREKSLVWQNRAHFCAIAATSMRQILVDRARARRAAKRGGELACVTLDEAVAGAVGPSIDILLLHDLLHRLAQLDAQQARIVELRFFGGLTVEECAGNLGVSIATVKRDWSMAKTWLKREMGREKDIEP